MARSRGQRWTMSYGQIPDVKAKGTLFHTYILLANIEIEQLEHHPNYETNDALLL